MSNNEKYVCINCVEQIAEKDTEIERLTSALLHVEQLHSISEARKDAEIKRLRKLLRQCQPFVDRLQLMNNGFEPRDDIRGYWSIPLNKKEGAG